MYSEGTISSKKFTSLKVSVYILIQLLSRIEAYTNSAPSCIHANFQFKGKV